MKWILNKTIYQIYLLIQLRSSFSLAMLDIIYAGANFHTHLLMHSSATSGITTITSSGDRSGGSITTATGHVSSTSGYIQTVCGIVPGKAVSCQTQACTGKIGKPITPSASGI